MKRRIITRTYGSGKSRYVLQNRFNHESMWFDTMELPWRWPLEWVMRRRNRADKARSVVREEEWTDKARSVVREEEECKGGE